MTEGARFSAGGSRTWFTLPIETAVKRSPWCQAVRSSIGVGISVILCRVDWDTDINDDRPSRQRTIANWFRTNAQGIQPTLARSLRSWAKSLMLGMWSEGRFRRSRSMAERSAIGRRQRLLADIPGFCPKCFTNGWRTGKQFSVVDPDAMLRSGVSLKSQTGVQKTVTRTRPAFLDEQGPDELLRASDRSHSQYQRIWKKSLSRCVRAADLARQIARVVAVRSQRGDRFRCGLRK